MNTEKKNEKNTRKKFKTLISGIFKQYHVNLYYLINL